MMQPTADLKTETDPVCGMKVDPARARSLKYKGKRYYFCNPKCLARFEESPQKYLRKGESAVTDVKPNTAPSPAAGAPAPVSGIIYTCPMDPQVRQDHPGPCPICGMALEPMGTTPAEETNDPEL